MKSRILACIILVSMISSTTVAQIPYRQWQQMEKSNYKLKPKYDNLHPDAEWSQEMDSFYTAMHEHFGNDSIASDHMIQQGFEALYREDPVTAMYRFNQAFLMNQKNTDIYWGYGNVYASMGQHLIARQQYLEGLQQNPQNPRLLTAYGTTYLAEYYLNYQNPDLARLKLDTAIGLTKQAYSLDPDDANTNYKLSIEYLQQGNCPKARVHLQIAELIGNPNITRAYIQDLNQRCPDAASRIDCSALHQSRYSFQNKEYTFRFDGVRSSVLNTATNKEYTMDVEWIDDCSFRAQIDKKSISQVTKKETPLVLHCYIVDASNEDYLIVVKNMATGYSSVQTLTLNTKKQKK